MWPKWSEKIVVLGRGVSHPSRTYRRICYCIAGIRKGSEWLRLYPVELKGKRIQNFDVIHVAIRDDSPESLRPETRKTFIRPFPKVVGHITDQKIRLEILWNNLDSGEFLHDESWRGVKSLGLIQPLYPDFEVEDRRLMVRYKCNVSGCKSHINEVMDWDILDQKSKRGHIDNPSELEEKFLRLERQHLLGRKQLWFVMGTLKLHPANWLLIDFHVTDSG